MQVINKGPSDVSKATIQLRWPFKTNGGNVILEMVELVENHMFLTCTGERILSNAHPKNATSDGNHYVRYCASMIEYLLILIAYLHSVNARKRRLHDWIKYTETL